MTVYQTFSDLLEITPVAFESAMVLGASARGDGGGGIFYWSEESTLDANGDGILEIPDVVVGRWIRFSYAV